MVANALRLIPDTRRLMTARAETERLISQLHLSARDVVATVNTTRVVLDDARRAVDAATTLIRSLAPLTGRQAG